MAVATIQISVGWLSLLPSACNYLNWSCEHTCKDHIVIHVKIFKQKMFNTTVSVQIPYIW